jgi:hypothetical protein
MLLIRAGVCPYGVRSCRFRGGVQGVELAVENSGDVSLEGSANFAVATAFLGAFSDVVPGSGVMDHPGHDDGMQGSVEAPITAPVEPVPDSVAA